MSDVHRPNPEACALLHNVKNVKELSNLLARSDVAPNATDSSGSAPLHSLAKRSWETSQQAVDLLYTFLTESDAEVNLPDGRGNTVLHIAVEVQDVDFIKMLLAFGANVSPLNKQKKTPLDICLEKSVSEKIVTLLKDYGAVRGADIDPDAFVPKPIPEFIDTAAREDERSSSVAEKVESAGDTWSTQVSKQLYEMEHNLAESLGDVTSTLSLDSLDKASSVGFQIREMRMLQMAGSRILCLDGAGMKCLLQLDILDQIEKQSGKRITEIFDWIIGTSTGGVIALMIVHAKLSVAEVRRIFHRVKDPVFGQHFFSRASSTESFTSVLRDTFGSMTMDEVKFPRVLITGVNKTYVKLRLEFFSNDAGIDPLGRERPVWKVARYTTAAPTYFEELDNYVDGGVLANNPSIRGLTEIQKLYRSLRQKLPIAMLVSVGAGTVPKEVLGRSDYQQCLFFGGDWEAHSHKDELSSRVSHLVTLLGNAIGDSEEESLNAESMCVHQGIDYYRFSSHLEEAVPIGEIDRDRLINMVVSANTCGSTRRQIQTLVSRLQFYSVANQKMARRLKKT